MLLLLFTQTLAAGCDDAPLLEGADWTLDLLLLGEHEEGLGGLVLPLLGCQPHAAGPGRLLAPIDLSSQPKQGPNVQSQKNKFLHLWFVSIYLQISNCQIINFPMTLYDENIRKDLGLFNFTRDRDQRLLIGQITEHRPLIG